MERGLVHVVDERLLAVDLDHGKQHPVAPLELLVAVDVDNVELEAEPRLRVADDLQRLVAQPAARGRVQRHSAAARVYG
jgi:hypothetical protein